MPKIVSQEGKVDFLNFKLFGLSFVRFKPAGIVCWEIEVSECEENKPEKFALLRLSMRAEL